MQQNPGNKARLPVLASSIREVVLSLLTLSVVTGGLVAACLGPDASFRSWDFANYLLGASTLVVTVLITVLGWRIAQQQERAQEEAFHLQKALSLAQFVVGCWDAACDQAVGSLSLYLYGESGRGDLEPVVEPLYATTQHPERERLLAHLRVLNRWASDVALVFQNTVIPPPFDAVIVNRARQFAVCAEPLNWAWHKYHGMPKRHARSAVEALARSNWRPMGAASGFHMTSP